jgi:hypothetical protein
MSSFWFNGATGTGKVIGFQENQMFFTSKNFIGHVILNFEFCFSQKNLKWTLVFILFVCFLFIFKFDRPVFDKLVKLVPFLDFC